MSEELSDLNNRLSSEFVNKVVGEIHKSGGNFSDVMVLLESVMVGAMLANAKLFGLKDHVSSSLVEMAVHRAMERFAAQRNKEQS